MTRKSKGHDPAIPPPSRAQKRDEQGLNSKERAFVLHYIGAARRVAGEAAKLAGYAPNSRATQRTYGHELLQRPHIAAEVDRLTIERNARLSVTADDILRDMLILKTEVETHGNRSAPVFRVRLDVLKTIGDHIAVGAFRKQVGLSSPTGGPIETVDLAALANLSDEELDQLERARAIIDRVSGGPPALPDVGDDSGGEGTTSQEP